MLFVSVTILLENLLIILFKILEMKNIYILKIKHIHTTKIQVV